MLHIPPFLQAGLQKLVQSLPKVIQTFVFKLGPLFSNPDISIQIVVCSGTARGAFSSAHHPSLL